MCWLCAAGVLELGNRDITHAAPDETDHIEVHGEVPAEP